MGRYFVCRCNGFDVKIPKGFRVRKYNNSLDYHTHNVLFYATKQPNVFVYCMMRSMERVTVRICELEIIAQNDHLRGHKYMHFSVDTPIENIVCEMLTKPDSLIVLDDDPNMIEQTLF